MRDEDDIEVSDEWECRECDCAIALMLWRIAVLAVCSYAVFVLDRSPGWFLLMVFT